MMRYFVAFTANNFSGIYTIGVAVCFVSGNDRIIFVDDNKCIVMSIDNRLQFDGCRTVIFHDNNLIFYANSSTEIKGENGSTLSFSDLQVGDFVEVEADILPSGKFLATEIEIENDNFAKKTLFELNPFLLKMLNTIDNDLISENKSIILKEYSLDKFSERLNGIYKRFTD